MSPGRYAAPLSIIETQTDDQQKCPYCGWGTHSLYGLDSWPDNYAGCASGVLEILADDEYLIYHTEGPTNPEQFQPSPTSPTEARPSSDASQIRQSVDG